MHSSQRAWHETDASLLCHVLGTCLPSAKKSQRDFLFSVATMVLRKSVLAIFTILVALVPPILPLKFHLQLRFQLQKLTRASSSLASMKTEDCSGRRRILGSAAAMSAVVVATVPTERAQALIGPEVRYLLPVCRSLVAMSLRLSPNPTCSPTGPSGLPSPSPPTRVAKPSSAPSAAASTPSTSSSASTTSSSQSA